MTGQTRIQRVEALFKAAAPLCPDEREALLAGSGEEADLVDEVRRLLGEHDSDDGILAASIVAPELFAEPVGAVPEAIGRYRVKRRLAVGGMGVVYLAEQDSPRREVAIKIIRPGLVSRELLKRFELEGAMLGRLRHPNIAQIYEAGRFEDEAGGWPYLAMEYVDGAPLQRYAEAHGLDTRARLDILARVCDAVNHAHQRGVIHRDLKPANILVDAEGEPKILDFGVARATESDLQVSTLHTGHGRLIGTLAYMSPEQILGRPAEIDTRSDVYALGVILYELLARRLPYELGELAIPAAAKVIAEQEPTSLTTISRTYRGDLETIVRKALEKAPARRYQSPADLASDIRHWLNAEPIDARPATTLYQLSRFARRNRALVGGVGVAMLALATGTAFATVFAIGKTRALSESEQQQRVTSAINAFLIEDIIELTDPDLESDKDITLGAAIDRAEDRIESRFEDLPLVEANLRKTIGKAYRHRNRLDAAEAQFRLALALYTAELGEHDEASLNCRMELNSVLMDRAEYAEAEKGMREVLAIQRRVFGEDHRQTIASINNLGASLLGQGRVADAEPLLEEAYQRRVRVLGEHDADTITTLNNLVAVYNRTDRHAKAAELLPDALAAMRRNYGAEDPRTILAILNLGVIYMNLDRKEESVALLEEAVALRTKVYGQEHRRTLSVKNTLASAYGSSGFHDRQEQILLGVLETQQRNIGPDHMETLLTQANLARLEYDRENYELAAAGYAAVSKRFETNYPDHYYSAIARMLQGTSLGELGRYAQAEEALLDALDQFTRKLGDEHSYTKQAEFELAAVRARATEASPAATPEILAPGATPD